MKDNHDHYRLQAIRDSLKLATEYDIIACIDAARRLCMAVEAKEETGQTTLFKEIRAELNSEPCSNPCLERVHELSVGYHGCRQLLSALYFIKGDLFSSDLWQQKHILGVSRALNKLSELNDRE